MLVAVAGMVGTGGRRRRMPPLGAIEAFVRVAEHGSLKEAADKLALSSPAVSRRIQSIERFMGVPLFDRVGSGMVMNERGEALFARLLPALLELSAAIHGTEPVREVEPVREAERALPPAEDGPLVAAA